jgi:hypothetical protein
MNIIKADVKVGGSCLVHVGIANDAYNAIIWITFSLSGLIRSIFDIFLLTVLSPKVSK